MLLLHPLGSLILVLAPSSVWPMITAEVPLALAKEPLSPVFASQFETIVPSGSRLTGKILPTESEAFEPAYTNYPVCRPSTATKYSLLCLYL